MPYLFTNKQLSAFFFAFFNYSIFQINYIDHDNKTITIIATYYVMTGDNTSMQNAQDAVDQWNEFSGSYITADGVEYTVSFNLGVQENIDPLGAVESDPSGNVFISNEAQFASLIKSGRLTQDAAGVTFNNCDIVVPLSIGNNNTIAHEVGHTLMLPEGSGVMSTYVTLDKITSVQTNNADNVISNGIN